MSEDKSASQPVDPKEFANFLQGLHLRSVRVRSLKVDADREFTYSEMQSVQHKEDYSFEELESGRLRVDAKHDIRLTGARKKKLGSISVVFSWYYDSESTMTEEIFEVFSPMVRFQTWPHLREIVQSVSTRANWPRLTLPLLVAPGPNDQ